MRVLLLGGAALLVFGLTWLVVGDWGTEWLPGLTPLLPLFLLWLIRDRLQLVPLSPVWIIAITIAAVGTVGYFLADQLAGLGGGSVLLVLDGEERVDTALIFAASVLAFVVGAVVASVAVKKRPRIALGAYEVSARARTWMLIVAAIPIIMVIVAVGPSILSRTEYLAGGSNRAIFGLAQQLATATGALVGYVIAAARGSQRVAGVVLMLAYVGVFFSLGSRRLAVLPIVFVIGALMARPTRVWLKLGVAGAVSVLALPIPLFLRSMQQHGLDAYVSDLNQYDLGNVDWLTTLNNVLIAFPITAASALRVESNPIEYFLVSINPLSGESAGWYEISSVLRLNDYTPFSTVGELWNYGPLVAVATWAVLGVIAVWLDRAIGDLWSARLPFLGLAVLGLSALFALQALQYNLRASSRMMLYAILLAVAGLIYVRLRDGARAGREARRSRLPGNSTAREAIPS